jgi:hypothetical protein
MALTAKRALACRKQLRTRADSTQDRRQDCAVYTGGRLPARRAAFATFAPADAFYFVSDLS